MLCNSQHRSPQWNEWIVEIEEEMMKISWNSEGQSHKVTNTSDLEELKEKEATIGQCKRCAMLLCSFVGTVALARFYCIHGQC